MLKEIKNNNFIQQFASSMLPFTYINSVCWHRTAYVVYVSGYSPKWCQGDAEETHCWIKFFVCFFFIYYLHIPNIAIVIIYRHLLECSPPHCFSWTVLHPSSRRPRTWWMPWSSQSRPPTWLLPSTRRCTARQRSIPRWYPGAWRPRRRNPWWRERNRRSARPVSGEARRKNTSPLSKPSVNSRPWTPINCTTDIQNCSSSFSLHFFSPCYGLFSWSCIVPCSDVCVCAQ